MEPTALVSVATGVIKPLVSKLSKLLEEEGARLKGVRRNTGFIRDELSTMGATLQILGDAEDLDPEMRIWRDGVRELSYDMEDCVDDFMARADHDGSTGIKGFFDKLKKLKPHHEIAGEIEKLKARAMEASERHKRYKIDRAPLGGSSIDPRLHALYVEVDKLVGIESPKQDIIKWFEEKASSTQLRVVSIVGPGGIGKTTLANQVYHAIKNEFQCAALLSVSRKPDMKNVLRNIAERVGVLQYTSNDDEQLLIDKLRGHLQDKKYIIVVDDIWDTEAWKFIKDALLNNNCGSRIITTTRNSTVASCCSSRGDYVYRMKPLSFTDSRRLLLKRAFSPENLCHPHLENVSKEILEKCAGLPLAIITVSSLLADQHAVDEWYRVLAAIGSGLTKDPNAGNMAKILSLSYFDLPHHMRTCLLYLSLFPEDCTIKKQRLISRWIAEGFVHEEQGRSTYEVGERYFNDLINRSLIQPKDVNKCGEAEACQVHDIVLDFITCKAIEENFITSFDGTKHGLNSDYRVRRLSFKHPKKITIPTRNILSQVRSLTIFGNPMDFFLMNFPSLRVLDLGECKELDDNLLAKIGKVFLLKYLSLGSKRITMLPRQLDELQYIETLDIKDTNIIELPSTISRLQRLARLYVSENTRFPDGIIGQMRSLEELSKFGVSSYEVGMSLQQFSQLTLLRRLTVRFGAEHLGLKTRQFEEFNSSVGTLISACSLHHLYLFGFDIELEAYRPVSLESWSPVTPCSLRKLQIESYTSIHVPNWMPLLGNLTELVINIFCMRPEDVAILGTMPTLFHLEVSTLYGSNGRIVLRGFKCLKYLKLEIKMCGTAMEFEAGSMQEVEHLKLQFPMHGMKCVNGPCHFGLWHLPALTKVEIAVSHHGKMPHDEVISTVRGLAFAPSISPTISLPFTNLWCEHFEHFLIKYLDENGSLPEGVEIRDIEAKRREMLTLEVEREQESYTHRVFNQGHDFGFNPGYDFDFNPGYDFGGGVRSDIQQSKLCRRRVRVKRAKEKKMASQHSGVSVDTLSTSFTYSDMHLELQRMLASQLGAQGQDSIIHNSEQDEGNEEDDSGLADTHAPFTFTATHHELEALLSGNADASEPAVAHLSALPFTFAAVRHATPMLGPNRKSTAHKSHVRATSKRGHGHRGKAALQRPPHLAAAQDPLFFDPHDRSMRGAATKAEAMDSSVSPSVP